MLSYYNKWKLIVAVIIVIVVMFFLLRLHGRHHLRSLQSAIIGNYGILKVNIDYTQSLNMPCHACLDIDVNSLLIKGIVRLHVIIY